MRSHVAAISMVSTISSRSRKKSHDGTVLRCASQCSTGAARARRVARGRFDRLQLGVDQRRGSLADHQQQRRVGGRPLLERARRLGRIVEPQHGGSPADPDHATDQVEARRHAGAGEAREGASLGKREDPQRHLGDDAERPLAAEEQLAQRRAGGRARHGREAERLRARQHHLETEQQILDVAVLGRELTRGARGDETAERGALDRLRIVAGGVAARGDRALVVATHHARLGPGQQRGLVEREQPVHRTQVDDHGSRRRHGATEHPRAAAVRDDGDLVALRGANRGRHLGGGPRADHARGSPRASLAGAQVREIQ